MGNSFYNRAMENRANAYNEQLPLGGNAGTVIGGTSFAIPQGIKVMEDGSVLASFHAPEAEKVCVRLENETVELSRKENGIWEGILLFDSPGLKPLFFEVDGNEVINSMAPIGFGWSRPINYVEVPEENCDFYYLKEVPHGTIAQEFYFSTVTGQYESCMLYLPPEYVTKTDGTYPVLYLQHGHGENEKCWIYQGKVNFIMDNLLAEGKAVPCIIVMNNGMVHTTDKDGNIIMDSSLLEHLLIDDCIPFIEGRYRVKTGKSNRAMAGLSMGSMQTSITTMKHPELFDYVGIFSGFLRSLMENNNGNTHLDALDDREDFIGRYKVFMRAMGMDDHFKNVFEEDNEVLRKKGLSPEEMEAHKIFYYPGSHEWRVWRKCIRDFLMMVFQ